MEYKDYYRILGVPKDAAGPDIQKAYRKLARKYHPDISQEPEAEVRFKEIGEAYEVLKDDEKRAKYDRFGSAWRTAQQTGGPPPGFENVRFDFGGGPDFGSSGFSSFFEALFGGAGGGPFGGTGFSGSPFGGSRGRSAGRPRQGQDVESTLTLGLSQAAFGGRQKVTVQDPLTGARRTLTVTVPKGVLPGQKIRLSGQGAEGLGGGGRGDLLLKIAIRSEGDLELDQRDLRTTVPITPWEAVLGGTARIRTLDGDVTVRIPEGTQTGRRIRLKGKGYPARSGAGDLFAEMKIVVPESPSAKERELYEKLAEISTFEPRKEPVSS